MSIISNIVRLVKEVIAGISTVVEPETKAAAENASTTIPTATPEAATTAEVITEVVGGTAPASLSVLPEAGTEASTPPTPPESV